LKHELLVEIANQPADHPVDEERIRQAVRDVLRAEKIAAAEVSVAIVDDPTIQALNARHLGHDWPTDVISFLLDRRGDHLEGEVVVSIDTARAVAAELAWPAEDELLLYVVHGALHLVGYGDDSDAARARMRQAERRHLAAFGLEPPWDESSA
jgi:probable rRNA maturation factor